MNENFLKEFETYIEKIELRIKELRLKAGLTQEKLAGIANIDYKFYQRIEYGKRNITLKTLIKICIALDVKPKEFFDFE